MSKVNVDIDKLIDGYYESDIHRYYLEKGEGTASTNALLSLRMKAGLARKRALLSIEKGAHIKGGKASIKKLQKWQKDNNHLEKLHKLERTDEWKSKIGDGNRGKVRSKELVQRISNTIKENNSKLTKEERSKKYGVTGMDNKQAIKTFKTRKEILDTIPTKIFKTSDARIACENYGLGNWKSFLKDTRIIKQIHKGTNKYNPSIYEKC